MEILSFCAGMLFFYTHNVVICFILCAALIIKNDFRLLIAFCSALALGQTHEIVYKPQADYVKYDNKNIEIEGKIISIPSYTQHKTQFYLQTSEFGKVLVNCYKNCESLNYHDVILGQIKLKKPRNFNNPGGFDYVNFLRARHVFWLGGLGSFKIISTKNYKATNLLLMRHKLSERLNKLHLDLRTIAIIKALSIGIADGLTQDDWRIFRNTGTIHLLVISGAHIGFIASMMFFLTKYLWSRTFISLFTIPSQRIASIFALVAAIIYSGLAGFSVSVQRALVACTFMLARNFLQVKYSKWQAWRIGLLVILLIEPHFVLIPGFYLSFIAVATLIISNEYFQSKKITKALLVQIGCLVGLMPFTLYWFNYGSINSFVANLVAIPLVGFLIVPLSLLCLCLSLCINYQPLNYPLQKLIDFLFSYLIFIDNNIKINISHYLSIYSTLILLLIIGLSLLLSIKALRIPILCLILTLNLPKNTKVKSGDAIIDVLDVGQGLAVLIRTAKHQLLFDTGGKFYLGKDLGELVIIPYMQTLGVQKLDMLVISHPDLDHRGGLNSIMASYPVSQLIVNDPSFYKQGVTCHNFPNWTWDGIYFEFLNVDDKIHKGNNDSCVLKIKSNKASILLTGDIENKAEKSLINIYGENLRADYLLVPHHGSKTSSSKEFLEAVSPKLAIFSYAIHNRYHFPHQKVINTYKLHGIKTQSTAKCGIISVNLGLDGFDV